MVFSYNFSPYRRKMESLWSSPKNLLQWHIYKTADTSALLNTCVVYRSINFSQLLAKQGGSVSTADLCLLQSPVAAALTRGNASSSFSAPTRAELFAITDNTRKPCHVISQRCHVLSTLIIYNTHSVLKTTSTYSLCRRVGNII